ncbi:MAG TPA: MBL fold metallo-hydrolase [Solirubrobacteraceae bacterium]|jgi:glyoxylase-like metal-dependent hydrolase (beta-lactamase superfamily II)
MAELDVRSFTVGAFRENCYIVRASGASEALLIDPGDEPERLIEAVTALELTIPAILITHTHIDHIGAVAALARHTGAPVYCPSIEREVLADIDASVKQFGLSGFESYEADELLAGGEHLALAGLEIDVHFTPGHSPGHLTFALPDHELLLAGDVLFRGSVGRVDLPGGDWPTLLASITSLIDAHPPQTTVLPGHGPATTLGAERETNPFLTELAAR